jgi:chromosome segregation ATPase
VLKKKSEEAQARVEVPKKTGVEQPQAEVKVLKETSKEAQARAEALKKKSEEAQAQAEALKKESEAAQARAEELRKREEEARAEALRKSSRQTGRSAPGEMTVGNDDPKAAARSLKEAIEAMNADSDAPSRGQPKKRSPVRPTQP